MKIKVKEDLLKVKDVIRRPVKARSFREEADQILLQLKDLNKKMEEIHSKVILNKESATKLKRKKQIIHLLKENGGSTAAEIGEKLKLSRTRCSEYLNELEEEGIARGFQKGRKKLYKLSV